MPLQSSSVYGSMKSYLVKSALAANIDPSDPDPDLGMPVSEIRMAAWGSHSLRRNADRRARDFCLQRNLPLEKVDKLFGWREAEHERDMQLHYDEDTLARRWDEAQVTWDW